LCKIFKGWACTVGPEQRAAADLFLLTNTKQVHWGFRATSAGVCWRMRKKLGSVCVCVCVDGRCLECFSCFRASYPIIHCWLWHSLERKTDENKHRGNSKGEKQVENDKTYMALIDKHALYQCYTWKHDAKSSRHKKDIGAHTYSRFCKLNSIFFCGERSVWTNNQSFLLLWYLIYLPFSANSKGTENKKNGKCVIWPILASVYNVICELNTFININIVIIANKYTVKQHCTTKHWNLSSFYSNNRLLHLIENK